MNANNQKGCELSLTCMAFFIDCLFSMSVVLKGEHGPCSVMNLYRLLARMFRIHKLIRQGMYLKDKAQIKASA